MMNELVMSLAVVVRPLIYIGNVFVLRATFRLFRFLFVWLAETQ